MKIYLAAILAAALCAQAAQKTALPKNLVFYDTNARNGGAFVTDQIFNGLEPHNGSAGIVMFGDELPSDVSSYTAPPRGPLVLSFVHSATDKPAFITEANFWVSNPLDFSHMAVPVPIKVFDPQGTLLATQETAEVEFSVSIQGVGQIGSIQIGEFDYPRFLMVSDIRLKQSHIIHDAVVQLTDPQQLSKANNFIDFETFLDGTAAGGDASDQWQERGVLLSDENGNPAYVFETSGSRIATRSGTNGLAAASQTLVITFVAPASGEPSTVREAGLWVVNSGDAGEAPSTIQFLDASGNVLESMTTAGKYFFAGARAKSGIARIVLTDSDYFLADDLQFSPVRRVKGQSSGDDDFRRVPKPMVQRPGFLF